ncbi:diguanylate cyclase DosC [Clostridium tepidiprofundi DSM 19306]|uniref:Diguanylate cyclase DosC n=1 Tax=Clostridium tepidiprofundi DSM 19306 TaxID=1121338 RepID=A0A151B4Q1_9CLOT|nr:diguanylate cyclase [Clostridium tepidiprofundi]KYH34879.1 diguanylate cyclase DosC [Clostridium tepidiprofundi DSM 19306]
MKIINNRYRIIRKLSHSKVKSSFLVSDVLKNSKRVKIDILNSEYIPEKLINFYVESFIKLSNIISSNIIRVYDFGLVKFIDSKALEKKQYFYTSEYFEKSEKLIDVVNIEDNENILEFFVQICYAINYLHLRGMFYNSINTDNILIIKDNGTKRVMLKDMASIELEKYFYSQGKGNIKYSSKSSILYNNMASNSTDMYLLGESMFYLLCKKNNRFEETYAYDELIEKIDEFALYHCDNEFDLNILKIIRNMVKEPSDRQFENIGQVIEEINKTFNKQYKYYKRNEIERLTFNFELIGREYEKSEVIKTYDMIKNGAISSSFIFIHGEMGIGKTKLLKNIEYTLRLDGANIYSSYGLNMVNKGTNKAFIEILKKIIIESNNINLSKYDSELIKFIPELSKRRNVIPSKPLDGNKEKLRLINRSSGFVNEVICNRKVVFIIDNFHLADEFTIDFFKYLLFHDLGNFLFVVSYCDGECLLNKEFIRFMNEIFQKSNSKRILLEGLNIGQTSKMIQNILNMPKEPMKFTESIYAKTRGNPLFVKEIIKNLFTKKIIYIDKKTGQWFTDYKNEELPIPINIEQAVLVQIKETDEFSYKILSIISIFNKPVSINIIKEFIDADKEKIEKTVECLMTKGVLCKHIEDKGFAYDYYNMILKNAIYNKICIEDRNKNHKLAAAILENQYKDGREEYLQELIYHLERSYQKQKIIDYCVKNSQKMLKFKNTSDALKNLEKALSMYDKESVEQNKIDIVYLIANIYFENSEYDLAMTYFRNLIDISINVGNKIYQIYAMNKIAKIYMDRNKFDIMKDIIKEVEKLLRNVKCIEGYIEWSYLQAYVYLINQEYKKGEELCEKSLKLCGNKCYELKGRLYNILGNIYLQNSETDKAIMCFKASIINFEVVKQIKGVIIASNNIGVIYGDFYQNFDEALKYYYKILKICIDNNFILWETKVKTNIASIYFNKTNYKMVIEYLENVIDVCEKNNFKGYLFNAYVVIANTYLRINKFDKAFKYYQISSDEMDEQIDKIRFSGEYRIMEAELHLKFGDIKIAKESIGKALNIYKYEKSILKTKAELLLFIINILDGQENIDDNIIVEFKDILGRYSNIENRLEIIYEVCIHLYKNKKNDLLYKIFNYAEKLDCDIKQKCIKAKRLFLKSLFEKNELKKLELLINALDMSKDDKCICWNIYVDMGDYYFRRSRYYYALIYYFEACHVAKSLLLSIPENYRVNFAKFKCISEPFNKFINAKNYINNCSYLDVCNKGITSLGDINELFSFVDYNDVINDEKIICFARKLYNLSFYDDVRDINDVLIYLNNNDVSNINMINKYMAYMTLASTSLIILDENDEFNVIASTSANTVLDKDKLKIINKVKDTSNVLMVSKFYNSLYEVGILPKDMSAVMCLPIIINDVYDDCFEDNRRKNMFDREIIQGYIYMESNRSLNNFTYTTLKECLIVSKLVGVILDKIKIKTDASIDKLTGTLTRKYLELNIKEVLEKANNYGGKFSMIMFDLDDFKSINDNFGHQTGDFVLSKICEIVKKSIRKSDILGRYGGEEFIVILPNTDIDDAEIVAEKLRSNVHNSRLLGDKREITISMGLVNYPRHAQWGNELIEKVDQALYVAKENGKNQYRVWSDEFKDTIKRSNKLSGIITGNSVQDQRNVLTMIELVNLIDEELSKDEKIFKFLGRIIETTEAEKGMLAIVKNGRIEKKYCREIFKSKYVENINYNENIINFVISKKEGTYLIDWDNITKYNNITGVPDWNSVICVPITQNKTVLGVVYLCVSTAQKEFNFGDFNFVNILSELAIPII